MFCPRCKAEYRAGFTKCSDCDVDLVDHLPVEIRPEYHDAEHAQSSNYVVITEAVYPTEVEQIRSFLESNDIPSEVEGQPFPAGYPVNRSARILVPRELAITALDLLKKAEGGQLEIDSADDEFER